MNKKEISELKKQFTPDNCTISRICGCYVDSEKEKRLEMRESFLSLSDEEMFKYFEIFKKTLSGTIGKNLLNLEFPLKAEVEGGEQEFLLRLKNSRLTDDALVDECYDKIIELYEQKDANTPFFLFNVTMQNHSSYSEEYDNFHPDITVEGTSSKILPNYLSLIKLSDQALENLIEYFSQADEDTIIVFFGDHQPSNSVAAPVWKINGRSGDSLTEEEEALRYKVPFIIWANYDIEAASNVETSANYLGSHVLRAAGLPLYDYRNYLSQLEGQYPVLTAIRAENAQGISTPVKDVKSTLQDYMTLQYYNIFSQK